MDTVASLGVYIINNAPSLVGFALPPLVELLNKDVKDEAERFWVAFLVCLVVAGLLHWKELTGQSPEQLIVWFGIVFTESQTTYNLYFKQSQLRTIIQQKLNSGVGNTEETQQPVS